MDSRGREPTEELAAEVGRRLHPAADREAGEAESDLLPHQEQIRSWLSAPPGELAERSVERLRRAV